MFIDMLFPHLNSHRGRLPLFPFSPKFTLPSIAPSRAQRAGIALSVQVKWLFFIICLLHS